MTHNAPKQSLRLLTWNVGKIYLPWESRATDRDVEHIARVIRRINPHIVALQEMRDREQLGRLLVKLGPGWRGRLAEDSYDRRAALLSRLRARFFELPTTSGRIAQAAEVTLPANKGALFVVSLHLDAFDPRRRLAQAEEMLSRLQRERPERVVVLGDFNLDPSVPARDPLDQQTYRLFATSSDDAGKEVGVTTIFSRRLDYAFVRRPHPFRLEARVVRGQRINTMDHDPLVVDLHPKKVTGP